MADVHARYAVASQIERASRVQIEPEKKLQIIVVQWSSL
jgi:hypothetical protein